jgi:hypothetical protein
MIVHTGKSFFDAAKAQRRKALVFCWETHRRTVEVRLPGRASVTLIVRTVTDFARTKTGD